MQNKRTEEKSVNEVYYHNKSMIQSGATGFIYNNQEYKFSDIAHYKGQTDTVVLKDGTCMPFNGSVEVIYEPINKANIGAW